MTFRTRIIERDLSQFAKSLVDATGGAVLISRKGRGIKKFQNPDDLIIQTGIPTPSYSGIYDAIEYANAAPLIVSFALGTGYAHAGIDIYESSVATFGTNGGRDLELFETSPTTAYNSVEINATYQVAASGNGITSSYAGTISPSGVLPITAASVKLKIGSNYVGAVDGDPNTITGTAINGTGSFNRTTGVFNFTLVGTPGTVANYTSTIDLSGGVDLSSSGIDKKVNIEIDKSLYQNVNFGQSATNSLTSIINTINAAVGYTAVSAVTGQYMKIQGQVGSVSLGNIKITDPTSGASALNLIFDTSVTSIDINNATSPTGFIPKVGEKVIFDFTYTKNLSTLVSHSIFLESPFDDTLESYAGKVERVSGKKYKLTFYSKIGTKYYEIKTYNYSLIREKDAFGKSLYYEDVFKDDPYLRLIVNPNFTSEADPVVQIVDFSGGKRGNDPSSTNISNAWKKFQDRSKYKCKLFLDFTGNNITYINDLVTNYQPFAFGVCVVPIGTSKVDAAISYRNGLGLDTDQIALYTNWLKVDDPYNGSFAWISSIGKTGVKYAQTATIFDGLVPAGIDENGIGGQLPNNIFKVVEAEVSYTDTISGDLSKLNDAQLNPRILDTTYGPMNYGNRTLQITNSDTSFIHTRRLYNRIIEDVSTQILRKQEFKLNDDIHRLLAKSQTDTYLIPILANNLLRDVQVVCDESNNTDSILEVRDFILDIYVKATSDSEFVTLRLTRLPQGAVIADFLAS